MKPRESAPLKVVHLVAGELSEGAARGAYWLHQAQIKLGIDSIIISSGSQNLGDPTVIALGQSAWQRLRIFILSRLTDLPIRLFRHRLPRIFSTGFHGFNYKQLSAFQKADIVHLHWINGLVSMRSLRNIEQPVVWTLRDMWPLTGGCHYSMGCRRYETGCGKCPQLNAESPLDLSHWVVAGKQRHLPRDIKVIGISSWLSECARRSKVFNGFSVETISNNIDTKEFFPVDQRSARLALGLPLDRRIVLAGAQNTNDFYKGFDLFLAALKGMDLSNVHVVLFGRAKQDDLDWLGSRCTNLGFLSDSVSLRLAYSAADVFVAPSREEAFGKTLAESLACGTPVVSFDATGPADIVQHHVNGYKAAPYEVGGLGDGINWILSLDQLQYGSIRDRARITAVNSYDSLHIAKMYIELYLSTIRHG